MSQVFSVADVYELVETLGRQPYMEILQCFPTL